MLDNILMNMINNKEFRAVLHEEIEAILYGYIPEKDSVIAGGAVANIILNILYNERLPLNDIDIFTFRDGIPPELNNYAYGSFQFAIDEKRSIGNIQYIIYDASDELTKRNKIMALLLTTFHINAVQVAYDYHLKKLYYTNHFIRFLNHRMLLLNPLTDSNYQLNILKAYKKHKERVGVLSRGYINSVMLGRELYTHIFGEKYTNLVEEMVSDKEFDFKRKISDATTIVIPNSIDKSGLLEENMCSILIENINREYEGGIRDTANYISYVDPILFLVMGIIDTDYLQYKLKMEDLPENEMNDLFQRIPAALARIENVPTLLKVVEYANKASETFRTFFYTYLTIANNLRSFSEIMKGFEKHSTKKLTPKLFTGQVVTPKAAIQLNAPSIIANFLSASGVIAIPFINSEGSSSWLTYHNSGNTNIQRLNFTEDDGSVNTISGGTYANIAHISTFLRFYKILLKFT